MDEKSNEDKLLSIVTIGKTEEEIDTVRSHLEDQTFQKFEFSYSTASRIPQAWNEAIRNASGDLLVFTETDAEPVYNTWLEEIVSEVETDNKTIVSFGDTGRGVGWCFANLAIPSHLLDNAPLNESYPIAEDTELFARLDKQGVHFEQKRIAPVYHQPGGNTTTGVRKRFQYGYHQARILNRHGRLGPSTITENETASEGNTTVVLDRARSSLLVFIGSILFYIGVILGITKSKTLRESTEVILLKNWAGIPKELKYIRDYLNVSRYLVLKRIEAQPRDSNSLCQWLLFLSKGHQ